MILYNYEYYYINYNIIYKLCILYNYDYYYINYDIIL